MSETSFSNFLFDLVKVKYVLISDVDKAANIDLNILILHRSAHLKFSPRDLTVLFCVGVGLITLLRQLYV